MSQRVAFCGTNGVRLGAAMAVAAFAILVGRFWHPYYGFTKFLQVDSSDEPVAIHELRDRPVYVYAGNNGYDGSSYAQIAFHPLLDSAELGRAIDSEPYRARRILGSAIAWLLAAGRPGLIANRYSELNIGVWLLFAPILWFLLPVRDWRGFIAWAGFLFSAGALHSVRLALIDLLAAVLFASAMLLSEKRRPAWALGTLAAACLARETAVLGLAAFLKGPWKSPRAWVGNALRTAAAVIPLGCWILYVRAKAGPAPSGIGNLAFPGAAWIEKWAATIRGFSREPAFAWLNATTLFATAGLSAQAAYFFIRRNVSDPWWRAGAAYAVFMMFLGTPVWVGHPGAAARILLPMGLAFSVLAVRQRAALGWLIAGNLTVFSGIVALWHVPEDPRELAAGIMGPAAYRVGLGDGWFGCEHNASHRWAWAQAQASLSLETWPRSADGALARAGLRALSPRTLEIRQGSGVLWRGPVGPSRKDVEFEAAANGAPVIIATSEPPIPEGTDPGSRLLGFAVYDLKLEKPGFR